MPGLHRPTSETHLVPLALQQAHSYFYDVGLNSERTAREHFFSNGRRRNRRIRDPVNHTSLLFFFSIRVVRQILSIPPHTDPDQSVFTRRSLSSPIAETMAASTARRTTCSALKIRLKINEVPGDNCHPFIRLSLFFSNNSRVTLSYRVYARSICRLHQKYIQQAML